MLLQRWRSGDEEARAALLEATYDQLKRLAIHYMQGESPNHTLQPTALISELYLKLTLGEAVDWKNRAHFFGVVANQMRHLLVDHARARRAQRRGGGDIQVTISMVEDAAAKQDFDVLVIEQSLEKLEQLDPRAAKVVELRFFAGLKEEETAEVLGVSLATVKRDWSFARAWLIRALKD